MEHLRSYSLAYIVSLAQIKSSRILYRFRHFVLMHSFTHSFVHSVHGLDAQSVPGRVADMGKPDAQAEHHCQDTVWTPPHMV